MSKIDIFSLMLQKSYLKITNNLFNQIIPLDLLENEMELSNLNLNIIYLLNTIFDNDNTIKFKVELLMMPKWAGNFKSYRIYEDYYTHIRIKRSLLA
jgi:hypothetical protein